MSFRRTNSGLSNQHLFHNVDIIVFTEGGKSLKREDLESEEFNNTSMDCIFWGNIFRKYRDDVQIKINAIGSKKLIREISQEISKDTIQNVVTTMDSDFDEIQNSKISHPKVLYTFGYSWENDVWNLDIIKSIVEELSAVEINEDLFDFKKNYHDFIKDIKIGVYADGYLFYKGESFFPRKNYLKCIFCDLSKEPFVEKVVIQNLINEHSLNKNTLYSFASRKKIDVQRYCFGHLLGDYCYFVLLFFFKKILKIGPLSKNLVNRIAIRRFILNTPKHIEDYYRSILNGIQV